MPIEFWKTNNGGWFWTTRSPNGEIIADSAEVYSSRSKAVNGAHATAAEFLKWRKENKPKTPKAAISARSKPAAKRSTSLNNPTRKTAKRGG
jgi:uncharacterized protein YegP (UPF0339 family)